MQIHFFKKHSIWDELYCKEYFFAIGNSGCNGWATELVTTAVLLYTSVLWFSHIESILADSCVIRTSCMNIVRCLHSVQAFLDTERVIVRFVHGTHLSVPFPSHTNLCRSHLIPSHPMGRFLWDSHTNDIPMDELRVAHGTYLSVPFPSHSNSCLSHPMGFPWTTLVIVQCTCQALWCSSR